ncbi:MAG TPA: hypothetical protein VIK86_09100 [Candidatus Paceibacterota bacterium]
MIKKLLWNIFYLISMNNMVPVSLSFFIDLKTSNAIRDTVLLSSCFIEYLSKKFQNRYLFITICFFIGIIIYTVSSGTNTMFYCIVLIYIFMIVRIKYHAEEEMKGIFFKAK